MNYISGACWIHTGRDPSLQEKFLTFLAFKSHKHVKANNYALGFHINVIHCFFPEREPEFRLFGTMFLYSQLVLLVHEEQQSCSKFMLNRKQNLRLEQCGESSPEGTCAHSGNVLSFLNGWP